MTEPQRKWTVIELLKWTTDYLSQKSFANARLNAEQLLCHVLHLRRVDLYVNFDRPLSLVELNTFKTLLKRRLAHEPLQYIIGETEFFSLSFKVGPAVLIPRPETELLVEKVIEYGRSLPDGRLLDLGTGSGCMAVTLAKGLPQFRITAIDKSERALALAAENAERHQVSDRVEFVQWDYTTTVSPFTQPSDILAANPPYVRQTDFNLLAAEIKDYEPAEALLAGEDGLEAFRHIQRWLPLLLKPQGQAFVEIGADQAHAVTALFPQAAIFADLAGRDRLMILAEVKVP